VARPEMYARGFAPPPAWSPTFHGKCPRCQITLVYRLDRTTPRALPDEPDLHPPIPGETATYVAHCDRCRMDHVHTITEHVQPRGAGVWAP
jgi:hypothetical protein